MCREMEKERMEREEMKLSHIGTFNYQMFAVIAVILTWSIIIVE